MNTTLIIFTAMVASSVGFCAAALLCARVVADLVRQNERLEEQLNDVLIEPDSWNAMPRRMLRNKVIVADLARQKEQLEESLKSLS